MELSNEITRSVRMKMLQPNLQIMGIIFVLHADIVEQDIPSSYGSNSELAMICIGGLGRNSILSAILEARNTMSGTPVQPQAENRLRKPHNTRALVSPTNGA